MCAAAKWWVHESPALACRSWACDQRNPCYGKLYQDKPPASYRLMSDGKQGQRYPEKLPIGSCLPQKLGRLRVDRTLSALSSFLVVLFIDVASSRMCLLLGKRWLLVFGRRNQRAYKAGLKVCLQDVVCSACNELPCVFHSPRAYFSPRFWAQAIDLNILMQSPAVKQWVFHPDVTQRADPGYLSYGSAVNHREALGSRPDFHGGYSASSACTWLRAAQNNLGACSRCPAGSGDVGRVWQGQDSPWLCSSAQPHSLWQWEANRSLITKGTGGKNKLITKIF